MGSCDPAVATSGVWGTKPGRCEASANCRRIPGAAPTRSPPTRSPNAARRFPRSARWSGAPTTCATTVTYSQPPWSSTRSVDDSDRGGVDPGLLRCLPQGRLDRSLVTVPGAARVCPRCPRHWSSAARCCIRTTIWPSMSLRRSSRPAAPLTPQWRCPRLHRIQPLPSPCTRSPASHHVCSGVPDRAACLVARPIFRRVQPGTGALKLCECTSARLERTTDDRRRL